MNRYFGSVLLIVFFAGAVYLSAGEALTLRVTPAVMAAQGNAQLNVLVERNDANRALIWEVDGPGYYRSSTMQLDGASAPRSYFFLVRNLPEGSMEVRARLVRKDDSEVTIRRSISVGGAY